MLTTPHPAARASGLLCTAVLLFAVGCKPNTEATVEEGRASLAVEGRWFPPDALVAVADDNYVEFTGAGPWRGESGCSGDFEEAAMILRDYLLEHFPQVNVIYGYQCRPIAGTDQMSVHGTGRALDIGILPTSDGEADNGKGDPVANWLMVNAETIGIQNIIWDRSTWKGYRSPGDKHYYYDGAHAHHDHVHAELSVEAADFGTPWFSQPRLPPDLPDCDEIPPEGGVIDDVSHCLQLLGSSQYWRVIEGEGYGGRLVYTNAYDGAEPGNWARWSVEMEAAGTYEVAIHGVDGYSVHEATRYQVTHAGVVDEITVDESTIDGWHTIGVFDFAAGTGQYIAALDNTGGPVAADQHIVIDAVRLTPASGTADAGAVDADAGGEVDAGLGGEADAALDRDDAGFSADAGSSGGGGGCSAASSGTSSAGWLGLLAVALLRLRSSRRRRATEAT